MNFEELKIEDIKNVAEIFINAFNAEPWNEEWTIDTASKRLHQMINCESAYGLVLYDKEKVLGMILGCEEQFYNGVVFNLREFCIDNKIRNKGYGKILFEELERRLKEKGITEITLNTLRGAKTEGFYKNRGFKECDEFIVMSKSLEK